MIENLTSKAQGQIMDALYESASTLAHHSNELFVAYEPDLHRFGYQSMSVFPLHYRVGGNPIEVPDDLDGIATTVDPRYQELPKVIEKHDEDTGTVTQMGHVLRSGQNLALGMEHAELIDIALAEVGFSNHFRRHGIPNRSILVASKAIDFMGVNVEALKVDTGIVKLFLDGVGIEIEPDGTVPVRKFLSIAIDATYLTIPSTQTFAGIRGVQGRAIGEFNKRVVKSLRKDMDRSNEGDHTPALLGVAVPGTTVKYLSNTSLSQPQAEYLGVEPDEDVQVIGNISPAITKFMGEALTYAVAVRLDQAPPELAVSPNFVALRNRDDVENLASGLVDLAAELEPGKRFIYDRNGDLPVKRR